MEAFAEWLRAETGYEVDARTVALAAASVRTFVQRILEADARNYKANVEANREAKAQARVEAAKKAAERAAERVAKAGDAKAAIAKAKTAQAKPTPRPSSLPPTRQ